jgi:hypothetical protein
MPLTRVVCVWRRYVVGAGASTGSYTVLPVGLALTKAWNDMPDVPSVGVWLGQVLDNVTDGNAAALVTSVQTAMPSLDLVRLIIKVTTCHV